MDGKTYRGLRESLGTRKRAAKILCCSPGTIAARERGNYPITAAAADAIVREVHELALLEELLRQKARERRRARYRGRMTPSQFKACCRELGWRTRADVARVLLGDEGDVQTVTYWRTGARRIPPWVARDLRALLGLSESDPWPSGLHYHRAVIPTFE